jgi:N4-gp56 family major capsid protein
METTSTLSNNVYSYYQKKILENARKKFKFAAMCNNKIHPRSSGTNYFQLRYGHVSANTTALTEGVVPTESTIDTNKYTVAINQYGQYIKLTDWVSLTAIDPVLENIADEIGYAAGDSIDQIVRDHWIANATTNIQYVGTGNTTDNNIAATEIFTLPDVAKCTRLLAGSDAPKMEDGSYVWIVHPYITSDLSLDTAAGGFQELNKYVAGLAGNVLNGEVGKGYGARIVESTNVSSSANATPVNVYRTFVVAKDSTTMTKFEEKDFELIVINPSEANLANPLKQVGSVGYKFSMGVKYTGGTFSGANSASPDTVLQLRGAATAG